jgi:hypothetical protein
MVYFFTRVWYTLRWWAGLILPVAGRVRGSSTFGRGVRWFLHVLVLVVVVVVLHYLNDPVLRFFGVRITNHPDLLRHNWLPILFLLFYVLCWLGWWLWKLLVTEEEYAEFPDITAAWEEARAALDRAGIDPRDVPLFLVLGRTEGPSAVLFQAGRLQLVVKQAPTRADAPLHVYATREAVYVTCEGVSLLGSHAALMAGEGSGEPVPGSPADQDPSTLAMMDMTMRPGNAPSAVPAIQAILERAKQEGRPLSPEEKRRIRTMARPDRPLKPPVRNQEEVDRHAARLEHLCRLLVRDRFPYCPVNCTLVVVPFAGTDTEQDALDAGASAQRDLAVARRVLQVNSPTVALVSDLETAPGFRAFVAPFSEKQLQQRVGQGCPLVPHLEARGKEDEDPRAQLLQSLAGWVCGSVFPGWVYKHFRLEGMGQGGVEPVTRGNAQMFLFMHDLRKRQRWLGRLLARAFAADGDEPYLFGGCYLAGTGAESSHDQAFVGSVFQRLASYENHVSWTAQALQEEANYRRWVATGRTALGVLAVATLALIVYLIMSQAP